MKTENTNYRKIRNEKAARFCKGCAWVHIGINVDHNHCDYTRENWDELEKRANGHFSGLWPTCRYYWAKKLNPDLSHARDGIFYKPPQGSYKLCPEIPEKLTGRY